MDIRLLVCRFIWDDGFGSISDALECLRLCKEEGAHVSSNSWGGVPHSSEPPRRLAGGREARREGRKSGSKRVQHRGAPCALADMSPVSFTCMHVPAQDLAPPVPPLPAGAIEDGLKEVEKAGMLFVVASGNQGIDLDARPAYPASSK